LAGPSISIVVPTYQRRDVVCDVVRALCGVEYAAPFEIIVVVDGSTDGTAQALAAIDCPVRLTLVEQSNRGASSARNRGAAIAANDVILFLDDDMIADPKLLDEHARLHCDGADAVIGDTPIHPGSPAGFLPESVARWIASTSVKSPLSPFDVFSGQLSVRRAVFEDLGGFDTAFTIAAAFGNEDADFGVRLLARHDVRHNPAAISRQMYVVTPRQFMERARRAVAADVHFVRKHPQLARELFERKGLSRPLARFVYRPLARVPLLPDLIARLAAGVADFALKSPFRSSRMIARFFSGARSLAYWSALRANGWLPFSDKLLVLCYHAIEDQSDDPVLASYGVPPTLFAKQLDWLTGQGFSFVTPNQLAAYVGLNAPLPRRPVLLTFDDGYADLVGLARDVLRPRAIEALAFVVTSSGLDTNEWDQAYGAKTINLLSAKERIDLASMGVEIGSHSRTHREMPLLEGPEQTDEAASSADDLVVSGLPRPRFFAYPFGFSDEGSKDAVRQAGYSAAFGCRSDWVKRGSDPFELPRVIILASDGSWRFRMKVRAPRLFANMAWLLQGIGNQFRKIGSRAGDAH
jgi:glycosyltransferase involved in cell wall biosynthesis/peptidoglycan/xylan/chitin deacetylase (PgdA/CDA1 family)